MADSVVVADNVELVANNIQSKVGSSLVGLKSAAQESATGISEPSMGVLDGIKTLQQKTVDKVHHVWEILKSTLDLQKDEARRARERAGDPEGPLGKRGKGKGVPPGGLEKATEEAAGGWGQRLMDMAMGAGATLFSMAGLTRIVGKIFKVALIFMLAGFVGDAIVDHFEIESESAKNALRFGLPAIAALMPLLWPLLGIRGLLLVAIPTILGMGFASLISWLKGNKTMDEVSGFDWGSIALTGPALMLLAKAGTGMKFATIAGLVGGWPIVLGASLAIALAAGIGYLFSKVAKAEQKMLDHLGEMTDISQEEFERRLDEQKAGFVASVSPGLADLLGYDNTYLGKTYMATKAAKATVKTKDGKLTDQQVTDLTASVDMFAKMDEQTLRKVLDDSDNADDLMKSIHNMYQVAQSGQLGDNSAKVIKQLAALSQNIQQVAGDMYKEKEDAGETSWGKENYLKMIASDSTKNADGGDVFERYANLIANPKYQKFVQEKEAIENDPRYQELKSMDSDKMDRNDRMEMNEFNNKLAKVNTSMHYMERAGMGSMGQIKMIDMLKLLTPEEQAQLLEQALSDKKVLLKAYNKLETDSKGADNVSTYTNVGGSIHTESKSYAAMSGEATYEVDGPLLRALDK
tara:strand:+ start:845 stop:2749 length:1905 start_codon:yes stop_codon:yes gene_type:complete